MEIKIRFDGGPLHKQYAFVSSLPEAQVFFPPNDRLVLLYVREDELVYVFDPIKSRQLTDIYDAAKEKIGAEARVRNIRFVSDKVETSEYLPPSDTFTEPSPFASGEPISGDYEAEDEIPE